MLTWDWVEQFWTRQQDIANLVIFLNIVGAMALGLLVGYERSYHGRAAGMRTYGIVCMASAALTVFVGYPTYWYGGLLDTHALGLDPTRVVQGIVTGVGFLGAGVIMKEGLNISGLTTGTGTVKAPGAADTDCTTAPAAGGLAACVAGRGAVVCTGLAGGKEVQAASASSAARVTALPRGMRRLASV